MIITEELNTPLSMGRTRQKINSEAEALNTTVSQADLTDVHRTLHKEQQTHILSKRTWNILQDRSCLRP